MVIESKTSATKCTPSSLPITQILQGAQGAAVVSVVVSVSPKSNGDREREDPGQREEREGGGGAGGGEREREEATRRTHRKTHPA